MDAHGMQGMHSMMTIHSVQWRYGGASVLLVKWISSGKRVRVQLSRYLEARESQRDGDHGRRAAGSAGESGADGRLLFGPG